LEAVAGSLQVIADKLGISENSYNLLEVDFYQKTHQVFTYPLNNFSTAATAYLAVRKESSLRKRLIVALEISGSIANLNEAYSYALQSQKFYSIHDES